MVAAAAGILLACRLARPARTPSADFPGGQVAETRARRQTGLVDSTRASQPTAAQAWADLDDAWREAFRQGWEALRTGNIPVGAVASSQDGTIVHAARNRVLDKNGPAGEIFGSALAHAEMNVLARLPFRSQRNLVLSTTLQPCLQCAAPSGSARSPRSGSPARTATGTAAMTSPCCRRARPSARSRPEKDRAATSLAFSAP